MFPSLVLAVGLTVTLLGQEALKDSNSSLGRRQLQDQARLAATSLTQDLSQADRMLDVLAQLAREHHPESPSARIAAAMRDLLQGRTGAAYVSLSFPDGTFQGAFVDADSSVRFQESRVGLGATQTQRFDYVGYDSLSKIREETSDYDPRKRAFYDAAVTAGSRVWTVPYAFFGNHYTGVTRAMPVYQSSGAGQRLHAVLTVDFDVHELSKALTQGQLQDVRTLLYAPDGTLLAFPQGEAKLSTLPLHAERPLGYGDLHDPIIDAFFLARGRTSASKDGFLQFEADGAQYVASQAPVFGDQLDWRVAYIVPEAAFFESLHRYGRRSLLIAAGAVVAALGLSLSFARLIVRVRQEARDARAEARRAHREAQELGSYHLEECLGKGGMGEVWRARHRLLARDAAIKLIRLDAHSGVGDARERFRREARALAKLRSRNTIEIFDYGEADDGTFFFVMELLDGLDWESLVAKGGSQTPGRTVRLLMQACRSLAEAHDAGLVHRDIKPANLFICRAADEVDLVKVLDFGLVRALAESPTSAEPDLRGDASPGANERPAPRQVTLDGKIIGTPDYIAPEQALGEPVDGRADLYALGCVAHWLLTGRRLFEGKDAMEVLKAHVLDPAPPLSEHAPGSVPKELEALVASLVEKDPARRPRHARELFDRLAAIERGLTKNEAWTDERARAWWAEHHVGRDARGASSLPAQKVLRVKDERAG